MLSILFGSIHGLVFAVEELPESVIIIHLDFRPLRRIEHGFWERRSGDCEGLGVPRACSSDGGHASLAVHVAWVGGRWRTGEGGGLLLIRRQQRGEEEARGLLLHTAGPQELPDRRAYGGRFRHRG